MGESDFQATVLNLIQDLGDLKAGGAETRSDIRNLLERVNRMDERIDKRLDEVHSTLAPIVTFVERQRTINQVLPSLDRRLKRVEDSQVTKLLPELVKQVHTIQERQDQAKWSNMGRKKFFAAAAAVGGGVAVLFTWAYHLTGLASLLGWLHKGH